MYKQCTIPLVVLILIQLVYTSTVHAVNMSIMEFDVRGDYRGHYEWAHVEAKIRIVVPTILPFNETIARLVPPDIVAEGYVPRQNEIVLKYGGAYIGIDRVANMTASIDYYNIYLREIVLKDVKSGLPVVALIPIADIRIGWSTHDIPVFIHVFSSSILSLLNGRDSVVLNLTIDRIVFYYDGSSDDGVFHGDAINRSPEVITVTIVYIGNKSMQISTPTITIAETVTYTKTKTITIGAQITKTIVNPITITKTIITTVPQTITKTITKHIIETKTRSLVYTSRSTVVITKTMHTIETLTKTVTEEVSSNPLYNLIAVIALIIAFIAFAIALKYR